MTRDSEWCLTEYNTLEAKEKAGKGLRYVIAKLDASLLPAFAAAKIYVDFSEQRDGPSGSGLLRLLYGLAGQPLPDEAIKLAARVDEETRDCSARAKRPRSSRAGSRSSLARSPSPVTTGGPRRWPRFNSSRPVREGGSAVCRSRGGCARGTGIPRIDPWPGALAPRSPRCLPKGAAAHDGRFSPPRGAVGKAPRVRGASSPFPLRGHPAGRHRPTGMPTVPGR
jgi:hypothetical protein